MTQRNDSISVDTIIRSKRKTISLRIVGSGELVVRAPFGVSDRKIQKIIERKRNWIEKTLENYKKYFYTHTFVEGEKFWFFGEEYPLHLLRTGVGDKKTNKLYFDRKRGFELIGVCEDPKKIFVEWYKREARKILSLRVEKLALKHGFEYKRLRITSARTRWGSCNKNKNINLSWRLVLVPKEVIDYVILHELCHTKHMNHSSVFWAAVESVVLEYRTHKKWLNKNPMRGYLD